MRAKVVGVFFLVSVLGFGGINEAHAERPKFVDGMLDSVASGGGKLVLDLALKAVAGYIYENHCSGGGHDVEQLLCGALGSFTGAEEQKWNDSVTSELAAIRNDLSRLEQGQTQIKAGVSSLIASNRVLLSEMDSLVDETITQNGIREIQALWKQQFRPLFSGESSFSEQNLLSFARQLVVTQQMHTSSA